MEFVNHPKEKKNAHTKSEVLDNLMTVKSIRESIVEAREQFKVDPNKKENSSSKREENDDMKMTKSKSEK